MQRWDPNVFRCPKDHSPLSLESAESADTAPQSSQRFRSQGNIAYPIIDGVPEFIFPGQLSPTEIDARNQYDHYYTEEFYRNAVEWQFAAVRADEQETRAAMVDRLRLTPNARVLEVGCGTGRDSLHIARRLGERGELYLQDISRQMVRSAMRNLSSPHIAQELACHPTYFVSSATCLPFPDDYFDAVYHFGGFNDFDKPDATLQEFARVTKIGGRVLIGDEGVAPWLAGREFGAVVTRNNPLMAARVPLQHLPPAAREVNVQWIMGNCFYVVDFRVGEGEPELDLDLPHEGRRGGTLRSRYYGQLEGVRVETKALALKAAQESGQSVHAWLDAAVERAAHAELGD